MEYAPTARILIRYGVGIVVGSDAADIMAGDPELVTVAAMIIGALVEVAYTAAKRNGWAT